MSSHGLQRQTAVLFAQLAQQRQCGPGTLSLCCGLERLPLPLAVIGLGGACLALTADATTARAARRAGATDFTVDTLGEALRILKNELRQQRPVSVAVVGEMAANIDQMRQRGVQPQVVFGNTTLGRGFLERGAAMAAIEEPADESRWRLLQDIGVSAVARRDADRVLLKHLPDAVDGHPTNWMQAWLRVAPRLFSHDLERWYWAARDIPVTQDR